jgi:hypothetical protein
MPAVTSAPLDRRSLLRRAAIGAGAGVAAPLIIGTHALALGSGPQPGGLAPPGSSLTLTTGTVPSTNGPSFTMPVRTVSCTGGATPKLRYRYQIASSTDASARLYLATPAGGGNYTFTTLLASGVGTWGAFVEVTNGSQPIVIFRNSANTGPPAGNSSTASFNTIVQAVCDANPQGSNPNSEDGWDCRLWGPFSYARSGNSDNYSYTTTVSEAGNSALCVWPATS